ncbi:MAG TPA: Fic family protein [Longimicrobiales bacterium]|nr:Fic family protein [Longimicrobiales bacterium]
MPRTTGTYASTVAGGETVRAFVPHSLPPRDPPVRLTGDLAGNLRTAQEALVRLEHSGAMVPDLDWFIYGFVRKEAVVSSQIEGTQASLTDLLAFEARLAGETAAAADVQEVSNYLDALAWARSQVGDPAGLPLSVRLLHGAHKRLLHGARGKGKGPGDVRRTQNWVGGTRPGNATFVPPPPHLVGPLLTDLERWLHADDALPPLVRVGLAHVQFETIHPYLDGNGRIGRLLVTLLLEHWGLLSQPLLYLSLHFKRHREEYYRRLGAVRTKGDWEGWLLFFLDGVRTIADDAVASAREMFALVSADRARVLAHPDASLSALRLFEALPRNPFVTVSVAMRLTGTTKPTAGRAIEALVAAGVLTETSGRKRDRSWAYRAYLSRLQVGTEL